MTQRNDILLRCRVDGTQGSIEFACIFFVHHHSDSQAGLLATHCAQYFKAANMRAHQKNAVVRGVQFCHEVMLMNMDIEQVEMVIDQVNPVVNRGGEAQKMPEYKPPADARLAGQVQCPVQVVCRGPPCRCVGNTKIGGDTIEHTTARAAAKAQGNPRHDTQHQHIAALGVLRPSVSRICAAVVLAHSATSRSNVPVAIWRPWQVTLKRVGRLAPSMQEITSVSPGSTGL